MRVILVDAASGRISAEARAGTCLLLVEGDAALRLGLARRREADGYSVDGGTTSAPRSSRSAPASLTRLEQTVLAVGVLVVP